MPSSIDVNLYVNSSPVEALSKTISGGLTYGCVLKEHTSILRPKILIATSDNITGYNYMYIQAFGRYYFIDDIVSTNDGRWEISAHVDVLTTYETAIKSNSAVIKRSEQLYNLYLDDPEYKTYNYDKIQTLKFKNATGAFNKTLNFVLVVNGS